MASFIVKLDPAAIYFLYSAGSATPDNITSVNNLSLALGSYIHLPVWLHCL